MKKLNNIYTEELTLNNKNIVELPIPDRKNRKIRIIHLNNNCLHSIPSEFFKQFPKLKSINISCNNFTTIPEEIFTLKKLKNLWAKENFINTIDCRLTKMKLKSCVLKGNPLPMDILQFKDFKKLRKFLKTNYCSQSEDYSLGTIILSP